MAENAPMEVDSPSTKQPRFQVKKWNAVCLWSWDIVVDNASNVKPTRAQRPPKNAPSLGVNATTLSTSTASRGGSRHVKYAHSTIENGNFKSTVVRLGFLNQPPLAALLVH
ncbi:hypothetical protein NDA13_006337 [Ustilago tritici]|nr:hypothetical protein NDA13_006337 [Ustilago tritici]